ncbi:MAG TPA: DUF2247 family protein [Acidobacteriota bacterium]|nr:DUF2247 family protein [Acidobacteriota bacterium]
MDWDTLKVGWEHGWISRERVIEFAVEQIRDGEQNLAVAELGGADEIHDGDFKELLEEVFESVPANRSPQAAFDCWRLVFLKPIQRASEDLTGEEMLDAYQDAYSFFDYPDDMRGMSRYSWDMKIPPEQAFQQLVEQLRSDCRK